MAAAIRAVPPVLLLATLAAALVGAVEVDHRGWGKDGPFDDQWLWGNLTWSGGTGGIRWGPPTGSETLTGRESSSSTPPEPDVFTSAPLPVPVYVNATRNVHVDLFRKAGSDARPCPDIELRIEVDGKLLASGTDNVAVTAYTTRLQPPEGFAWCLYRMAPELAYLPRGAILTLTILYVSGETPYRFGSAEPANSMIRLPMFLPEEAVYRMPEIVMWTRPAGTREDAAKSLAEWAHRVAGASAVPLWGPAVLGRKGRRTLVLAAAIASVLFAGCAGPAPPPRAAGPDDVDRPAVSVGYYGAGDTGLANETVGSILGRVQDPWGLPVRGAFVGLRPSTVFTRTGDNGLFAFKHLPPRDYVIRFDKETFDSVETTVTVKPDAVAQLDVTLRYASGIEQDRLPHRHDYWGAENSTLIFDAPLMATCSTHTCDLADEFYIRPVPGKSNLVRPGTSDVEVVLSFDPAQAGYERLGLIVHANHAGSNWSYYGPRPSGVPFHLRTTWEMTDVGHQLFSTWTLRVQAISADAVTPTDPVQPLLAPVQSPPPTVVDRATITIHRGALPLEPPHPDHWEGATELTLRKDGKPNFYEARSWNGGPSWAAQVFPRTSGGCYTDPSVPQASHDYDEYKHLHLSLGGPGQSVPPETGTLALELIQSRATGIAGTNSFGWRLWYKSGETPPVGYWPGADTHRLGPAGVASAEGRIWTWTVPVAEGEADGAYNKWSAWRFVIEPDDPAAACNDRTINSFANNPISFTWSLVAHKAEAA